MAPCLAVRAAFFSIELNEIFTRELLADAEKVALILELSLYHRPIDFQLFESLGYIVLRAVVHGYNYQYFLGLIGFPPCLYNVGQRRR